MTSTRATRLNQIIQVLYSKPDMWWSRAEIARAIGLRKTPHINALIEQLVADEWAVKVPHTAANGVTMYLYRYNNPLPF